jgi:hypothetical protein
MNVIQARGKRKGEVSTRQNIFGIAAIHGVSGKNGLVAEILHAVMTVPAFAIDATHPGDADTHSERQFQGRALDYFSHDLMTGNKARSQRRKIAFDDVKICAADSASDDPQ